MCTSFSCSACPHLAIDKVAFESRQRWKKVPSSFPIGVGSECMIAESDNQTVCTGIVNCLRRNAASHASCCVNSNYGCVCVCVWPHIQPRAASDPCVQSQSVIPSKRWQREYNLPKYQLRCQRDWVTVFGLQTKWTSSSGHHTICLVNRRGKYGLPLGQTSGLPPL